VAPGYGYGIVAMAALGYGGPESAVLPVRSLYHTLRAMQLI